MIFTTISNNEFFGGTELRESFMRKEIIFFDNLKVNSTHETLHTVMIPEYLTSRISKGIVGYSSHDLNMRQAH